MNKYRQVLLSTSRIFCPKYISQPRHRGLCQVPPPKVDNYQDLPRKEKPISDPITWRSLGILAVAAGGLALYVTYVRKQKDTQQEAQRKVSVGKAKIGGPFSLVDHEGVRRTNEHFKGQWLLVYFGFTHCPDICPEELEKLAKVVDKIDADKNLPDIQPLFITVDPMRDSKEAIKTYIAEFSPKFIGLTGTTEEIAKVCKNYRVYFSAGPKDLDDDYIVDHSIIIFLIDPSGNFVDYYGQNLTAEEVTSGIHLNIIKYESKHK